MGISSASYFVSFISDTISYLWVDSRVISWLPVIGNLDSESATLFVLPCEILLQLYMGVSEDIADEHKPHAKYTGTVYPYLPNIYSSYNPR